jgi:hypothetical protein
VPMLCAIRVTNTERSSTLLFAPQHINSLAR